MRSTVDSLPSYLRKYCVEQTGDKYTARDHAAWRFIMRQSRAYFRDHAVPIYLDGLKRTGVTVDRIPLISEMDARLQDLGWGAVPVCGFIPPAAFLDFQARRVLPIAFDMRSVEHIAYTPAPDIVHEAAGHAPIIADREYSEYLTMYATMAQKTIFAQEDLDVYEAIRALSDIKENPDSTTAQIAVAEERLTAAHSRVSFVSEANKIARMNWWTVEYGLLGALNAPKIYGAGLLSSVGESQACLLPKVHKVRLTVDCVETSYDITEPQPQLFVAEDVKHLSEVLKELETTLSFKRGGTYGLEQALRGRTVTSTVLDSGLEISGKLVRYDAPTRAAHDGPIFVRWEGPVQLAEDGVEIANQGVTQHAQGFSSPLGRFRFAPDKLPHLVTDEELNGAGIRRGARARLELTSGFVVEGVVHDWRRSGKHLQIVTWKDCRVTLGSETFFQPDWGDFDMAVGGAVTSVYGGPADREKYGSHDVGAASTTPGRQSPFTTAEISAFDDYKEVRGRRAGASKDPAAAVKLATDVAARHPDEWLLRLEALELAHAAGATPAQVRDLSVGLQRATNGRPAEVQWLVQQGLALAPVSD